MRIVSSKLSVMGPPDKGHHFVREEHTLEDGSLLNVDSPHTSVDFDYEKRMRDRVAIINSEIS